MKILRVIVVAMLFQCFYSNYILGSENSMNNQNIEITDKKDGLECFEIFNLVGALFLY